MLNTSIVEAVHVSDSGKIVYQYAIVSVVVTGTGTGA